MALSKAKLKYLRSLRQKKFREREKKFLVEGFRLTSEAVSSDFIVDQLFYTGDFMKKKQHADLVEEARRRRIATNQITARELESFADTVTAQGVVALVHERESSIDDILASERGRQLILALDAVSEPGNVGTAIRTADWFGVSAVLLGKGTVELYNPKVVRSTMGSLFHLPIAIEIELPEVLGNFRRRGFVISAASVNAERSYDDVPFADKALIILGNEARGVSPEVLSEVDHEISIKRIGKAESLNVGVASGILLARYSKHGR